MASYRYGIDLLTPAGEPLGSVPVEPDWEPALEWTQFLGLRRQKLKAFGPNADGRIEPVWDSSHGQPVLSAVHVQFPPRDGAEEVSAHIPVTYFKVLAQEASRRLVESGQLSGGDQFRYKVCAYLVDSAGREPEVTASGTLSVEEVSRGLSLDSQPLERFLANSTLCGVDAAGDDVQVFIPRQVVEEVVAIAKRTRTVETGGVLVGSLHRAASTGDIFVEVRAQIPALHTESSAARLTFTPETWSAVRAAIELRGQDELLLGWHHSHPNFCRECPPEKKNRCLMSRSFFSATDCHLHRVVFPRAYQIGLLLSDHGEPEFELNLFGWRHGSIESRGFHVLEDSRPSSQQGENAHDRT